MECCIRFCAHKFLCHAANQLLNVFTGYKTGCVVGREIVITGHRTGSVQLKVNYLPAKAVLTPEMYVKSANCTAGQAKVRLPVGQTQCRLQVVHAALWKIPEERVRCYSDTGAEVLGKTTTIPPSGLRVLNTTDCNVWPKQTSKCHRVTRRMTNSGSRIQRSAYG